MTAVDDALAAVRRTGRPAAHGEVVHARSSILVRVEPGPVAAEAGDAADAGRALRCCHDALAELALDREPLWLLHEARALARDPVIAAAVDRAEAELSETELRPVHGDSHAGNVLWSEAGPLWGDWEDAQLAPLEWDLACLVIDRDVDFGWSASALDAHGAAYDHDLLERCVRARTAQGAAYLEHLLPARPELRDALAQRVDLLRSS